MQLVNSIKTWRPDLPVVLGRERQSANPEFPLATSEVDALVLGKGDPPERPKSCGYSKACFPLLSAEEIGAASPSAQHA